MKNRCPFLLSIVWLSRIVAGTSQSLAVDCGSRGGKDEDGRIWGPDEKFHFYASAYSDFSFSNSYFSVTTGGVT
ncbi:hypothetical protein Gotur_012158 [Gossypium turneri]